MFISRYRRQGRNRFYRAGTISHILFFLASLFAAFFESLSALPESRMPFRFLIMTLKVSMLHCRTGQAFHYFDEFYTYF